MLEHYFKYPRVLRRLRSGALGEEMDRIAAHLFELGYKRGSAKIYVSRIARFSEYLADNARASTVDRDTLDHFLRSLPTAASRIAARVAIEHARRIAPHRFSTQQHAASDPDGPLLASYLDHLRHVRGLELRTCEGLLVTARRTLVWYHGRAPSQHLAAMTGEDVLALVQHLLSLSANHYTRTSATSGVRTFLRFLRWSGLNSQDLARFVPRTPCWRLAHLPSRLAWEDVRRVVDAIDATTPSGVRDRALLLLLTTTGLRNKELRSLELQDIRWRSGEVLLQRTKAKRDRVVPLLQEAGAALAEYVLHARPRIHSQRVFLSYVPPVGPFRTSSAISRIVPLEIRTRRYQTPPGRRRSPCAPQPRNAAGEQTPPH